MRHPALLQRPGNALLFSSDPIAAMRFSSSLREAAKRQLSEGRLAPNPDVTFAGKKYCRLIRFEGVGVKRIRTWSGMAKKGGVVDNFDKDCLGLIKIDF